MIPMISIAQHLTAKEIRCRCECGLHAFHKDALAAWDNLRLSPGIGRLDVQSGIRCAKHNRTVDGSPNSQHLLGRALDLSSHTLDLSADELVPLYLRCGFRGIGRFLGADGKGVHLDVRVGKRAFFKYTDAGVVPDPEAREIALAAGFE